MTLAEKFKALRADRRLSLADISKRTGLERTTIWKIEHGYLPRGGTLQKACLRGLGIKQNSTDWEEIQALWTAERTGQPITAQELARQIAHHSGTGRADLDTFIRSAAQLHADDFAQLDKAIRRPAVLRGLAALNALYEQAQATDRRSNPARRKSAG